MTAIRRLLLASAAISLTTVPVAMAAAATPAPILLAQADTTSDAEVLTDPVAIAEKAVEDARAALRQAMSTGDGINEARRGLRAALKALEDARAAAGLPPSENTEAAEQPAPAIEPPAEQQPAAEQAVPPAEAPPPAIEELPAEPPPAIEPPPVIEEIAPPPPEQAPALEQLQPPPPQQAPAIEQLPPPPEQAPSVEPPPAAQPPQVEAAPTAEPPPAQPPATDPPAQPPQPPQAPVVETAPPPVIALPPPAAVEPPPPPPPPPPAAEKGPINLERFTERPRFGEAAPNAPPPPALPQSPEAIKEGSAIPASDGRVIVKHGGQVTVVHDDSARFRQRGDDVRREKTANDTETVTIRRPDGTEIVTVFDRYGNIVQRYRKNRDGSVQVLIGDVEQPGLVGRIFGRGAQPAPPQPRRPPTLNLGLGPVQLNIPMQQYIVESSRADEQQLQQTLLAPPVETVERPYTLEEVRRSGRLRDKVRRVDFDTITFDTGKATIGDNQIPALQNIGTALRQIIERDPTQVFLIEGHTDAVGSDLSNLALSDRRAETVAQVLSYYYGIPAENLITQGYGEQFLKVPTVAANRENRRVAFRNITYLLRADAR